MYVIRETRESDTAQLLRLARLMQLINLPNDEEELRRKCRISERSFKGRVRSVRDAQYMFVLEESSSGRIVGTSSVIGQHGTNREPHMYFLVGKKKLISRTTHRSIQHDILSFKFDTRGPSEIAGLVMDPSYRKSEEKLGRFLSFVRFVYMGMYPRRFRKKVLAELLPPFLANGSSLLWEALGKKFTHMDYHEADKLSRQNKEFVTSLFPKGDIYIDVLPGSVRDVIGQVGPETAPVKHMLEKIGFRYMNMVDPFDGGPHYWVDLKKITLLKVLKSARAKRCYVPHPESLYGIVAFEREMFKAVQGRFLPARQEVILEAELMEQLECVQGDRVWFMPYPD